METTEQVTVAARSTGRSSRLARGYLAGITGGACWAIGGIAGELIFTQNQFTSNWLVPTRMLFSSVLILALAALTGKDLFAVFRSRKNVLLLLLFAVMGVDVCQYGYYTSVQYSTAALGTILSYAAPIFVLLWCALREKRWPYGYELLSLALVVVGTFLCATHGRVDAIVIDPRALFWGIVGAIGFAFYTLVPQKLIDTSGLLPVIGWGMLLAFFFILPFCRPWEAADGIYDAHLLFYFLLVVVFGTILSFSLYQFGCSIVGGFAGSILSATEPILSVILSVFLLHDRFAAWDFLGFALIIATVPVIALGGRRLALAQERGEKPAR